MNTPRWWSRRKALRAGLLIFAGSPFLVELARNHRNRLQEVYRRTFEFFGTRVHVVIQGSPRKLAELATREAAAEAERIHHLMSTHDPQSPLSHVNQAAGRTPLAVDWRIREVVARSLTFSHRSDGLFDVTTLPLLKAWGFRNYRFDEPVDEKRVRRALEVVGYRQIELDDTHLGLKRSGAAIDLGGIAKGFAVDRMIEILQARGITRALVEAGGDLYALGSPIGSDDWTVGIQTRHDAGVCAMLQLHDQAVATSGISESHLIRNGREIGHLMDPISGEPAHRYASTTVVASTVLEADALSTTLFVAGDRKLDFWPARTSGWIHVLGDHPGDWKFESGGALPQWQLSSLAQGSPERKNRRQIFAI